MILIICLHSINWFQALLFNDNNSIYQGFVSFYDISTIVGYLNAKSKSCLYIYIKFIRFGWVGFYGISTIVGYLIPNPVYTYILNI